MKILVTTSKEKIGIFLALTTMGKFKLFPNYSELTLKAFGNPDLIEQVRLWHWERGGKMTMGRVTRSWDDNRGDGLVNGNPARKPG